MKKARFLLVLCLVAALALGMAMSVSAETTEPVKVNRFEITMNPLVEGDILDSSKLEYEVYAEWFPGDDEPTALPDSVNVTLKWDNEGEMAKAGETYNLIATITAKEGYEIVGGGEALLNEQGSNGGTLDEDGMVASFAVYCNALSGTGLWIESFAPEAGTAVAPYSYTSGNEIYTLAGTWYVYDYSTQTATPATGNFEAGKIYQLQLTATAGKGWYFEDMTLYTNDGSYAPVSGTDTKLTFVVNCPVGEFEYIDWIHVSGMPESIQAGDTIGSVSLTSDSNVTLTGKWVDADGNQVAGKFEAGKVYWLEITATPKAGSLLWENVWFANDHEGNFASTGSDGLSATVQARYSLIPKVEQVDITGITDAVVGQAPTIEGIKVPEGVNYVLADAYWYEEVYVEGEGWNEIPVTTFQNGHKYYLRISVAPAEGYELDDRIQITVDGKEQYIYSISSDRLSFVIEYSFVQEISRIDITGVTHAAVGQTPTIEGIQVPAGTTLDTVSSGWYDWVTGEKVEGTFQKGHTYYLQIVFRTDEGYEIADTVSYTVNGERNENAWFGTGDNGRYGSITIRYSFRTVIGQIDITGVTDPVVGQTPTLEGIKLPEGVVLETEYSGWYKQVHNLDDDIYDEVEATVFEDGCKYYLRLVLRPADGYEFKTNAKVTVNGNKKWNGYIEEEYGYVTLTYSFMDMIDKVEISGVTGAVIGQTATTQGITITGANIRDAAWLDENWNTFTGTFENGKKYYLQINFNAADGYEFNTNGTVTVNGVECEDFHMSNQSGWVELAYSFKTAIDKVEITGLPTVAVGGTPSVSGLKIPENANYTMEFQWQTMEGEMTETFQNGNIYGLSIELSPKDGYEFSEDVQILVDGKACDAVIIQKGDRYVYVVYVYMLGIETIDKVEITVDAPVVGEEISIDSVKIPEDAKYELTHVMWGVSEDGKNWEPAEGVFEAGKQYMLVYVLETDEGEYLSTSLVVTINGEAAKIYEDFHMNNIQYMQSTHDFGKLCDHSYGSWTAGNDNHSKTCSKCGDIVAEDHLWADDKDEKCDTCGYVRSDNPNTGDTVISALLLAMLSAAALVVIGKRRK